MKPTARQILLVVMTVALTGLLAGPLFLIGRL
jgi:hypothetical protein